MCNAKLCYTYMYSAFINIITFTYDEATHTHYALTVHLFINLQYLEN